LERLRGIVDQRSAQCGQLRAIVVLAERLGGPD
jgi:hypothetical protein